MFKKAVSLFLGLTLCFSLAACGDEAGGVPVQRADSLIAAAGEDRYAAMVVSEDVTEIKRDPGKAILELYVALGDEVKAGDKLFSYDLEALELELEKQQLELEKMKNEETEYAEQLLRLEQQLSYTYNEAEKTRITLQINTLKTTQLESSYQMIAKEKSIADLQEMLGHVDIVSPVDGTVRQVNEEDGAEVYISIQQEGAYRVKGKLNEMSMGGGLMPGSRVRAVSRLDSSVYWEGTVLEIGTDEPSQNQSDYWYGVSDPMSSSSSYVFFVELDSTEGLLLGQHLYVELAPAAAAEGLWVPESFFTDFGFDEASGNTTAKAWVAGASKKLEQRDVVLGAYDGMNFSYEVLEGLAGEDYIASPWDEGVEVGAAVSYRNASDFSGEAEG